MAGIRAIAGAGLSPRVRGRHDVIGLWLALFGSIPACAGEANRWFCRYSASRVYPRVCGGGDSVRRCVVTVDGLSPRVRGRRWPVCRRCHGRGSIPACAGEA